jgi:phosphotransferase system HPr (HPr) family protein
VSTSSEARARLPEAVALHARPAGIVVQRAAQYSSSVQLAANGRCANAKSILELLALGAEGGTELVITASGDDAAAAVDELAAMLPQLV